VTLTDLLCNRLHIRFAADLFIYQVYSASGIFDSCKTTNEQARDRLSQQSSHKNAEPYTISYRVSHP
jgi:hypothetical protein